jgi:uncharacterized ferritin-like protein (DUF455 family)
MEKAADILLRILRGGSLNDKLCGSTHSYSELKWDDPASALLHSAALSDLVSPGREGSLKPSADAAKSAAFPKRKDLQQLRERGRLLHFFANHELLAIETMAFTLLKFPDAPDDFKRGLWHTLQDEQKHLGMYVERMREYGVDLGSVPVNLYFWNVMKTMRTPLDYVTRMSLTFEAANLDFALEYAEMFEKEIDDEKTALLLRKVHDDEVNHVAHGMKWFERWKNPDHSQWEAYEQSLPFPLTPRRARGGVFFAGASRLKAGMQSDFVDQVKIAGGSRGKIPNYFYFNPQCELESSGVSLSPKALAKVRELAEIMLWLGRESDVVELPEMPPLEWLKELHTLKGELPEIVVPKNEADLAAKLTRYLAFDEVKPWGWGAGAFEKARLVNGENRIRNPQELPAEFFSKKLFSKAWWKSQLGTPGTVIHSFSDWTQWRKTQNAESGEKFILKASVSTSGRGHQVFSLSSDEISKIETVLKKTVNPSFVIEPYYQKRIDFSVQYEIMRDRTVKKYSPRFFLVDQHLQYRGSLLGEWGRNTPYAAETELIEKEKASWQSEHEKVLKILLDLNYVGPVGIDALLCEKNGSLAVVPIIEVNVRYTMGRVAQEIEQSLKGTLSSASLWLFFNPNDLTKWNVANYTTLAEKLTKQIGGLKFVPTMSEITHKGLKSTFCAVISGRNPTDLLTVP